MKATIISLKIQTQTLLTVSSTNKNLILINFAGQNYLLTFPLLFFRQTCISFFDQTKDHYTFTGDQ